MIGLTATGKIYAGVLGAGVVLGLLGGWGLWHPRPGPVETRAPSVRQKDSSLVLARRPDTTLKIAHEIPKGWVPERQIEVGVAPTPLIVHDTIAVPGEPGRLLVKVDTVNAPPVRIALTFATLPDGTHRVIASSPDGRVLDSLSVDVPVGKNAAPERVLRYALGVTRDLVTSSWGAIASRDLGPFRVFAIGEPAQHAQRAQFKLGVGLRF